MNRRILGMGFLFFVAGAYGYAGAQRGGGGRQSPMVKLMNDLQQATPRAKLSGDQNDKLQSDIAALKMRNKPDAKGNRWIKTRYKELSMTSTKLRIVVHFRMQIRSSWTGTSLRFNHLSSNTPLSDS